jgi:uncharacterized alpha-E superfamily protein
MTQLLSRNAENFYWSSRYLERAENTARIVMAHVDLHVDLPLGAEVGWSPLLDLTDSRDEFAAGDHTLNEQDVLHHLLADRTNPSSILSCADRARENIRSARYVAPPELWESVTGLHRLVGEHLESARERPARRQVLRELLDDCLRLNSQFEALMSRDDAYLFWCVGRDLERADMTTRVIDVRAATLAGEHRVGERPFDAVQWTSALHSVGAYHMYRRACGGRVDAANVLRFLLQAPEFPSSVFRSLDRLIGRLKELPNHDIVVEEAVGAHLSVHEAPLGRIGHPELHRYIEDLQSDLDAVHELVEETYWAEPVVVGR